MRIHKSSPKYGSLEVSNELAHFIRQRRQELRMTCTEAAELAGLSGSQWKALELGRFSKMQDIILFTIAGTLEVSADLISWLAASN